MNYIRNLRGVIYFISDHSRLKYNIYIISTCILLLCVLMYYTFICYSLNYYFFSINKCNMYNCDLQVYKLGNKPILLINYIIQINQITPSKLLYRQLILHQKQTCRMLYYNLYCYYKTNFLQIIE